MKEKIFVTIYAAAGGDESELFAKDMYRMYSMYAAKHNLKVNLLDCSNSIEFEVVGEDAYKYFQYEGGVHRVQRVPKTESKGRVHTSTVAVTVIKESILDKVVINMNDLEITTCRSSGAGGQHVNRTESKVRIVHKPTGIVTESQEERSQYKNKEIALNRLKKELLLRQEEEYNSNIAKLKSSQAGTGARNEKIRTYNFKDNRVTDHRYNITVHNLDKIMNGDLDKVINQIK